LTILCETEFVCFFVRSAICPFPPRTINGPWIFHAFAVRTKPVVEISASRSINVGSPSGALELFTRFETGRFCNRFRRLVSSRWRRPPNSPCSHLPLISRAVRSETARDPTRDQIRSFVEGGQLPMNWRADVLSHSIQLCPLSVYRDGAFKAVRARGGCSDAYRNRLRAAAHAMSEVRKAHAACSDRAVTVGARG
jgi:hypothetical protein